MLSKHTLNLHKTHPESLVTSLLLTKPHARFSSKYISSLAHVAMCEMKIGSWVQVHSHIHPGVRRFGIGRGQMLREKKHIRIHQRAGLFWSHDWRASRAAHEGAKERRSAKRRLPKCSARPRLWLLLLIPIAQRTMLICVCACNEKCSAARPVYLHCALRLISRMLHSYTCRPTARPPRQQNSLGWTDANESQRKSEPKDRFLNRFCIFYWEITWVVRRLIWIVCDRCFFMHLFLFCGLDLTAVAGDASICQNRKLSLKCVTTKV